MLISSQERVNIPESTRSGREEVCVSDDRRLAEVFSACGRRHYHSVFGGLLDLLHVENLGSDHDG
jgi:hypothetical protein